MRIVFGVVVPRDGLEDGAGGEGAGLGQAIAQLPVKIVIDAEKSIRRAARFENVVFETFAAKMHVWEKTEQHCIVGQRAVDFHPIVGGTGRNYEMVVGQLQSQDALSGQLFGEDQADAGLVTAGCP